MMVGIIGENAIFYLPSISRCFAKMTKEYVLIYAFSTRLRSKPMTVLGAIIALMSLALGIGIGFQLHRPLAIAVIGSFLVALPLLLVLLPSLLNLVEPN